MTQNGYDYFKRFLGETYLQEGRNVDDKVAWVNDGAFTGDQRGLVNDFRSVVEKYETTRLTGRLYEVRVTNGGNIDRVDDDDIAAEGVVGSTDVVDGLEASVLEDFTGPWDHEGFDVDRLNRLEGAVRHNWRYSLSKPEYDPHIDFSMYKPGRELSDEYGKFDPPHAAQA